MDLMETAMENSLHLCFIKDSFLNLSSGVLVVESESLGGGIHSDSDLRVVVFISNLPDIKRVRGCIGQEAEEQDDGVRWWKTIWMNLLGGLGQVGVFVQPVGNVAVKGTGLHGHAIHASKCPVCNVESF